MSTNFYLTLPGCVAPCSHCEKVTELHIGKFSGASGGSLSVGLQGYRTSEFGVIDSWATWKRLLRRPETGVRNEYGAFLSVEKFIDDVEAVTPVNRARQYQWMKDNGYLDGPSPTDDWLDVDGFSFTFSEFS